MTPLGASEPCSEGRPPPSALRVALLTMSYRGDYELCGLLCETADRFVPPAFHHVLAVPAADMALFRPLAARNRVLVTQESLLPRWLWRLPSPPPGARRLLRLPRRNMYATLKGGLVRGWIAQQMMKLAASRDAQADVVLHVDSDVAFVRPLTPDRLLQDGRVRLLRTPGAGDTPMHRPWHVAASRLLGLPPAPYQGADYIGNLTTWRPAVVAAMLARIGEIAGRDPFEALARTRDFSEYVLYGAFWDHVMKQSDAAHAPTDRLLCATVWPGLDPDTLAAALDSLVLAPDQVAIGIQSTVPVPIEQRRLIARRLSDRG